MTGSPRRLWGAFENAAALAILLPAILFAGRYGKAMATTSLWTDEFAAMVLYTSRGPIVAATHYEGVGNHILFSVASSVLPGRGSAAPLRARAVSFAAVALLLAGLGAFFLFRRAPVVAAVAVSLFAANQEFLDLALQARGYGLAAALALEVLPILRPEKAGV